MLLLIGGGLRLLGLGWGIPQYDPALLARSLDRYSYHLDEYKYLWPLTTLRPTAGDFDIKDYHWGALQFYLIAGALQVGEVTGVVPSPWSAAFVAGDVAALPRIYMLGVGAAGGLSGPDTRLAASAWMRAHLAPGTHLVVENKNQLITVPHPVSLLDAYQIGVLPVTDPDSPAKRDAFAATLAAGDVLVVPNRRWAAVLPRLPDFPRTGRYYRLLAAGELGYTPLATFASPPRLGPWTWPDDNAEETFQVFDHPTVRLYQNSGHLSEATLRRLLDGETPATSP